MSKALDELRKVVAGCTACHLRTTCKQPVFDRGDPTAPLMVIGEAPGEEEDKQGWAFVGKAGQLLVQLLQAARVPDEQVYFANVLKCRPPKNRFPREGDEAKLCRGYLIKQIKEVKPKAIILAGSKAIQYVLAWGTTEQIEPVHAWVNKQYRRRDLFGNTRLLATYHPSYLLRNQIEEDQESWINAAGELWVYIEHKLNGTPPPPTKFKDIRPAPKVARQGRNLFGDADQEERRKVL